MRGELFEDSAAHQWHHKSTRFAHCISLLGSEKAPLASTEQSSMPHFLFESAGSTNCELMQNVPSESPTSVRGVQLACGAGICCNSESPSPAARNTHTLLLSKEAAIRCSPLHWNPQIETIEFERRCVFGSAPNGSSPVPLGERHISCTKDEPQMAQYTLPLTPVANDDQLLFDSCRVTDCTSAKCSDAFRRRQFTRIKTGLEVCSVTTMNGRLGVSLTGNSPLSMLFAEHENTCNEQEPKF